MTPIRYIRIHVFKLKQVEFAALIGSPQSSVSRWENSVSPTLQDVDRIRCAARKRGLVLPDEWFFNPPFDESLGTEGQAA